LRVAQPEGFNELAELLGVRAHKDAAVNRRMYFAKIEGDFLSLTVRSVKASDWGEGVTVSNLTVDGDHTYTLPSATTHNCDSLAMAAFMSADTGGQSAAEQQVVQYENVFFKPRRRGW
jgi:hypothetical protein